MKCDCGKEAKTGLNEVRDFRGNSFAVVCDSCRIRIKKLLDKLFAMYGGHIEGGVVLASCWHSPSIRSEDHLKQELAEGRHS